MGCTHSKNSKSKSLRRKEERPLDSSTRPNRVPHFDETHHTTQSTSNESSEEMQPVQYSKNLLNDSVNPNEHESSHKKLDVTQQKTPILQNETVAVQSKPIAPVDAIEKKESPPPQTAVAPAVSHPKQFVASTYYPMPTVGEKQKSPEKKKARKKIEPVEEEKKKKKDLVREKGTTVVGPNYRPQLTPEDLEYIKRSVQQRNERRAYMMTHRNESDDTLYELEVRMPEKDYTNHRGAVY